MSFKVLTECPVVVVLIYQLQAPPNDPEKKPLPDFVPLAMSVLASRPILQEDAPARVRDVYGDVVAAQVKTFSFIAYILNRGIHDALEPFKAQLPDVVLGVRSMSGQKRKLEAGESETCFYVAR